MRQTLQRLIVVITVTCCSTLSVADDPDVVNVLRLPIATLDHSTAVASEFDQLKLLSDGDESTISALKSSAEQPFTVVYGFSGKTVSLSQLILSVGVENQDVAPPARFDLLVSTVSAHAGFQSIREEALKPDLAPQEFNFTPIAAKWVMLRFIPGSKSTRVSIAEINLKGYEGAPMTRYQFNESPARAIDVLQRLEKNAAIEVSISKDEADLFEDAKDGKLDRWSFSEAALLSSGILDQKERKRYLAQLTKLETEARFATANSKAPFDKGAALLKFLHAGPMSKGYVARQTTLSGVLDTGTFNCVSSATLYNILGRRLGLDLRGIEVPNHAFSIQYEGAKHADIETTTAAGFNPSRDPAALREFTELTGFAYIPDSNRADRREVGDVGLIAITYYNRGVGFSEEKQYHPALLAYFRAMSLDPEFDSSVKNALAVLVNWSAELAGSKQHEKALDVLSTGLALAPKDASLVHNHRFVWSDWADSLMKTDKNDEALAVLKKAAKAIPDGNFVEQQAWVFIRQGEELIKANQWDKALALVEPGLEKIDAPAQKSLRDWATGLPHRQAQAAEKDGQFSVAVDVIDLAIKRTPKDQSLTEHHAYLIQEWIAHTYKNDGNDAAVKLMKSLLERYPKSVEVKQVAKNHVHRTVKDKLETKHYVEALDLAIKSSELISDEDDTTGISKDLTRVVFDQWANDFAKDEKWQEAIDVYVKGLKQFPKDEHLANNLRAIWSDWAQSYIRNKDWSGAVDVFEKSLTQLMDPKFSGENIVYCVQEWAAAALAKDGPEVSRNVLIKQLKRFPQFDQLVDVAQTHVQKLVQKFSDDAKYTDALSALDQNKSLLKSEKEISEVASIVYDTWSAKHQIAGEWQKAVDVYAKGLEKFPKNPHLEQNSLATWYQWAKTLMDQEDWKGAIQIYEKALVRHPENSVFTNNIKFCNEQLKKK